MHGLHHSMHRACRLAVQHAGVDHCSKQQQLTKVCHTVAILTVKPPGVCAEGTCSHTLEYQSCFLLWTNACSFSECV
jgi:hypothetical protein